MQLKVISLIVIDIMEFMRLDKPISIYLMPFKRTVFSLRGLIYNNLMLKKLFRFTNLDFLQLYFICIHVLVLAFLFRIKIKF